MAERIRRIVLSLLSAFAFVVLLRGCGDPHNYTPEQAEQYLEERYDTDFTLSGAVIETNAAATSGTATTYATLDPMHYYFHDENDIPCTFNMTADYGCSSNKYFVTEDYQLQWVKCHTELCESLSKYNCRFSDGDDDTSYGLCLDAVSYMDIDELCKKLFDELRNDEHMLPDRGISEEWSVFAKRPVITLNYADDKSCTLNFRTKEMDQLTDEEVFTYRLKCLYAETHKKENISDICDNTFIRVLRDGKTLDVKLTNKDMTYCTSDRISSGGRFRLENAGKILEAAGLKVSKLLHNKLEVTNGSDTVEIIRRKKNNTIGNVDIEVLKNGKPYIPEGGKDEGVETVKGELSVYPLFTFTTSDYINLFGITFNYDFDEGTADIR